MTGNGENGSFAATAASRRAFIKKFAAGAFVTPVIASFALDGIASAAAGRPMTQPNQVQVLLPNQTLPNQTLPNQTFPNQACPNQTLPNMGFPNQGLPNQGLIGVLERDRERLLQIEMEIEREIKCRLAHGAGCNCFRLPGLS
jgi:hypothetical protein